MNNPKKFVKNTKRIFRGGRQRIRTRLQILGERVRDETERETGKTFEEILSDLLDTEGVEADFLEEALKEAGLSEEPEEAEEKPTSEGRDVAPITTMPNDDEKFAGMTPEEREKETERLAIENEVEAEQRKELAKTVLNQRRKALGLPAKDEPEYEEYDDEEEDVEEEDEDAAHKPVPLTLDNFLQVMSGVDPRLAVAAAGIKGIKAAIEGPGTPLEKFNNFSNTFWSSAINGVLGPLGVSVTESDIEKVSYEIGKGLMYVFDPGMYNALIKNEDEQKRRAENVVLVNKNQTEINLRSVQSSSNQLNKYYNDIEELSKLVNENKASEEQKKTYAQHLTLWSAFENGIEIPEEFRIENIRGGGYSKMAKDLMKEQNLQKLKNDYLTISRNLNALMERISVGNMTREEEGRVRNEAHVLTFQKDELVDLFNELKISTTELDKRVLRGGVLYASALQVGNIQENIQQKQLLRDWKIKLVPPTTKNVPTGITNDGIVEYFSPAMNPFTGEPAWASVYDEKDGWTLFEAWANLELQQENTSKQIQEQLVRRFNIQTKTGIAQTSKKEVEKLNAPWAYTKKKLNLKQDPPYPENLFLISFKERFEVYKKAVAAYDAVFFEGGQNIYYYKEDGIQGSATEFGILTAEKDIKLGQFTGGLSTIPEAEIDKFIPFPDYRVILGQSVKRVAKVSAIPVGRTFITPDGQKVSLDTITTSDVNTIVTTEERNKQEKIEQAKAEDLALSKKMVEERDAFYKGDTTFQIDFYMSKASASALGVTPQEAEALSDEEYKALLTRRQEQSLPSYLVDWFKALPENNLLEVYGNKWDVIAKEPIEKLVGQFMLRNMMGHKLNTVADFRKWATELGGDVAVAQEKASTVSQERRDALTWLNSVYTPADVERFQQANPGGKLTGGADSNLEEVFYTYNGVESSTVMNPIIEKFQNSAPPYTEAEGVQGAALWTPEILPIFEERRAYIQKAIDEYNKRQADMARQVEESKNRSQEVPSLQQKVKPDFKNYQPSQAELDVPPSLARLTNYYSYPSTPESQWEQNAKYLLDDWPILSAKEKTSILREMREKEWTQGIYPEKFGAGSKAKKLVACINVLPNIPKDFLAYTDLSYSPPVKNKRSSKKKLTEEHKKKLLDGRRRK